MVSSRLEVRLDPGRRLKLEEIAQAKGLPISEIIRELIDRAFEEKLAADRMQAVEEIARLEIEDVPDPETLSRQLGQAYDLPDLY